MNYAPLLEAISFAADKHSNQRRKDHEASPYINHPITVATILASEGEVDDETLLIAAILHDTVEDTKTTFSELEYFFGIEITNVVREVTDDKDLEKQTRKDLQITHALHASPRAKQIKIADKISNIRDITNKPPADWEMERKQKYLEWSCEVVDGCRGVNPVLDKVFDDVIAKAKAVCI
ncbi:MAG: HD domain-containing protein [Desulfuromonadaceae bacterium]|nr:HD domain-containing protein [Desulfuromonadaceae bacterium]MDD2856631.1 HD domain-containing protein [Desulfuromonadaceae bacterium]